MTVAVSDARSNANDQIAHAANALRSSPRRKKVFIEIYRGKKKAKTVAELTKATKLTQVAVLQDGGKLAGLHIVNQIKIDGKTAYEKDVFIATNKNKILALAGNPKKLKEYPTKYNQKSSGGESGPIRVIVRGARVQITPVTCDDFDQFSKAKKIKSATKKTISEKAFKAGVLKLIGDKGDFQDWGGEKNDLYTTKLKFKRQRRAVAFAFKGPGMQGTLTPKKLGKNGDQIQRLFLSAAEIFIVQYHSQIDQSVIEQMVAFATMNSVREGKRIWYGVIDGDDTNRLMAAYPKAFGL
ncbi:MAG: hypothetical protein KGL97_06935 [Alphaproteobacteria bacterium]|nr:hypothetical protein [Alphaproteobacteria bacterium]